MKYLTTVVILCFVFLLNDFNAVYSVPTTVIINRSNFASPNFKASWDSISTPNFEPQQYPTRLTDDSVIDFDTVTSICKTNGESLNPSFYQIFFGGDISAFNLCNGTIYGEGSAAFDLSSNILQPDIFYVSSPLIITTPLTIYGIVFLNGASLSIKPGGSIFFRTTPLNPVATSYDPTKYFPGILSYGAAIEIEPTSTQFITGTVLTENSITISNGITSLPSGNFILYSETSPNGRPLTSASISGTTLSWTGTPNLDLSLDVHVTVRMLSRELISGAPYSIFATNGGSISIDGMVIAAAGRTSNIAYDCTDPLDPEFCLNQRSRSPVYSEFSSIQITNSLFVNMGQRADIIAHHSTISVQNSRFYGNTGSSILAEWGTEKITSSNNIYIKSQPSVLPNPLPNPANMDYGFRGNAIYSISPNIISNNDFIYSTSNSFTGISIDLISNRVAVTGTFFDYSLASNIFQYANLTDYIIDITGTQFQTTNALSVSSGYAYSTIQVKGLEALNTGVSNFNLAGDLIIKGNINNPGTRLSGSLNNLIFDTATITNLPPLFIQQLNINSVQFKKSVLLNNFTLDSKYTTKNDNKNFPIIYPTTSITPGVPNVPLLPSYVTTGDPISASISVGGTYKCSLVKILPNSQTEQILSAPNCNSIVYTTLETDSLLDLRIDVLDTNDALMCQIPLGKTQVIPITNKYYHGIDFTDLSYINDTFDINITSGDKQQWSLCTSRYFCSITGSSAVFNLTDFSSTYPPNDDYKTLYEDGIQLSNGPSVSLKFPAISYYQFRLSFISFIDFQPFVEANLALTNKESFQVLMGDTQITTSLDSNVKKLTTVILPVQTITKGSSIQISFNAPSNVFLTSFSVYSTVSPPSYIIYPTPTSPVTSAPVTKGKDFNIVIAIVPAIVGAALVAGIVVFLLWRRKKRNEKPKGTISPLKGSLHNSPLKSSGSSINMSNLGSSGKTPLTPQQSSRNLLTSSGSFKSTVVKEDKYHVDAEILSFVQESHFYAWDHPDFPLTFSNTKLDFGMGGMKCPIDQELVDSFILINKSKKPINVTMLLPASTSSALCDTDSQSIVIKPGKPHQVNISVKLLCTTKFMEKFAIHIEDFGHTFLFIHLESVLSTKLDFNELEFFQPPIGEGSFGIVYRGQWRGQEIAIKQMKVSSINMDEVYREMDLMSKLRHPNIISFIGAVMSSDNLCIVSEFVPLGSLADILYKSNKKLSLAQKIRVALDIAKGCNFLHQCGIIHRDLKPDNILVVSLAVDAPITIKISDFGTSKEAAELDYSKFTNAVGTPIYMSNQILEKKDYDNSTDVYSYAIMFYEIIIEEVPFAEIKNMWDIPRFVISGKRPTRGLDNIDPAIVKIINECWAHDATQRPAFKDVIPRLEEILEGIKAKGSDNNV